MSRGVCGSSCYRTGAGYPHESVKGTEENTEGAEAHDVEFHHTLHETPAAPTPNLPSRPFGDILCVACFRGIKDENAGRQVFFVG